MELTAGLLAGIVLAGGGLVGVAVGYVARRHRDHPAAAPLSMMAIPPGLAGLCAAGTVVAPRPPLSAVLLAASVGLLTLAPPYFLLFTLVYTGHEEWLTRRRRRALVAAYVVIAAIAMVEPLVLSDVTVRTVNGLTLPVVESRTLLTLLTLLFIYPLILAGNEATRTLPIAVANFNTFQGLLISRMAAAIIVIVLPMFLSAFYVQNYLVQGLAKSGVDG